MVNNEREFEKIHPTIRKIMAMHMISVTVNCMYHGFESEYNGIYDYQPPATFNNCGFDYSSMIINTGVGISV